MGRPQGGWFLVSSRIMQIALDDLAPGFETHFRYQGLVGTIRYLVLCKLNMRERKIIRP